MDNVCTTNNGGTNRFTVTLCADELIAGLGTIKKNRITGERVTVSNDNATITTGKSDPLRIQTPVTLVYGFKGIRNLDAAEGVNKKITVDLLNHSLNIAHFNLCLGTLRDIQQGVRVTNRGTKEFARITRIDNKTARQLLQSWSDYLQREYDFISIQSALKRRLAKRNLSKEDNLKYLAVKNYAVKDKMDSATLRGMKVIFDKFIRHGDEQGFVALQCYRLPEIIHMTGIVNSIFFRKTSKLALKWSHENNIPVNFDMDFTHKAALKKNRQAYQPITFSEYKYFTKNQFENVKERHSVSQQPPFYLRCLGKK